MAKRKPGYRKLRDVSDEVMDLLKRSDRKMEYMEHDLKREECVIDYDKETVTFIQSREDSYERLLDNDTQFVDDTTDTEGAVMDKLMIEKLHECMDMLPKQERDLIIALYFDDCTESQAAARFGVSQPAIHKRKTKALLALKKLLES